MNKDNEQIIFFGKKIYLEKVENKILNRLIGEFSQLDEQNIYRFYDAHSDGHEDHSDYWDCN
jgi:hypothetical protein